MDVSICWLPGLYGDGIGKVRELHLDWLLFQAELQVQKVWRHSNGFISC